MGVNNYNITNNHYWLLKSKAIEEEIRDTMMNFGSSSCSSIIKKSDRMVIQSYSIKNSLSDTVWGLNTYHYINSFKTLTNSYWNRTNRKYVYIRRMLPQTTKSVIPAPWRRECKLVLKKALNLVLTNLYSPSLISSPSTNSAPLLPFTLGFGFPFP